ncbi:MAG: hypothetical protein Q8Q48_00480 [Candidatus Staskawiczbacteria bacterium]|nr:hypothetical protein [Candidatus Staskawiczbacteria bacterium]
MAENLRPPEEQPEKEQSQEEILDALKFAFEKGVRANLTVSEPSGGLRTNAVLVEGFEGGVLYVSGSKDSPVMGIKIGDVKRVEAVKEDKEPKE